MFTLGDLYDTETEATAGHTEEIIIPHVWELFYHKEIDKRQWKESCKTPM